MKKLILISLVVVVCGIALTLVYQVISNRPVPPVPTPVTPDAEETLTGYIYFSAEVQDGTRRSEIRRYSLETGEVEPVLSRPDEYLSLAAVSDESMMYLTTPLDTESPFLFPYTEPQQFVVASSSGTRALPLTTDAAATPLEVSIIRNVDWLPDVRTFTFSGVTQAVESTSEVNLRDPQYFSLYVADTQTNLVEEVSGGRFSPRWYRGNPDVLYFLQQDGMYALNRFTGNIDTLFSRPDLNMSRWSSFAFTPDGERLVVAAPDSTMLYTYRMISTDPMVVTLNSTFDLPAGYTYRFFPVGTQDKVGYAAYTPDQTEVTLTIVDVSSGSTTPLFTIPTTPGFDLQAAWSPADITLAN